MIVRPLITVLYQERKTEQGINNRHFCYYCAAREGNAQSRNGSNLCQKKTKWPMDLPEGFASYSLFNGADICRERTDNFWSSCKQKWKSNWSEQNKLRGVIFPPISTPNDYLDTVVDDVVSLRWSKKNALPRSPPLPRKSFNLMEYSPCEWKVFPYKMTRKECYL